MERMRPSQEDDIFRFIHAFGIAGKPSFLALCTRTHTFNGCSSKEFVGSVTFGEAPSRAGGASLPCQSRPRRACPHTSSPLPCTALTWQGLALITRTGGTRSRAAADGEQATEGEDTRSGEGLRGPLGRLQLAGALPHPRRGAMLPMPGSGVIRCSCPFSQSPPVHRSAHQDP